MDIDHILDEAFKKVFGYYPLKGVELRKSLEDL